MGKLSSLWKDKKSGAIHRYSEYRTSIQTVVWTQDSSPHFRMRRDMAYLRVSFLWKLRKRLRRRWAFRHNSTLWNVPAYPRCKSPLCTPLIIPIRIFHTSLVSAVATPNTVVTQRHNILSDVCSIATIECETLCKQKISGFGISLVFVGLTALSTLYAYMVTCHWCIIFRNQTYVEECTREPSRSFWWNICVTIGIRIIHRRPRFALYPCCYP
jgi:hypothetical protein